MECVLQKAALSARPKPDGNGFLSKTCTCSIRRRLYFHRKYTHTLNQYNISLHAQSCKVQAFVKHSGGLRCELITLHVAPKGEGWWKLCKVQDRKFPLLCINNLQVYSSGPSSCSSAAGSTSRPYEKASITVSIASSPIITPIMIYMLSVRPPAHRGPRMVARPPTERRTP